MRAYVFTDKALERYAGQFVWLAIDTEKASNAAFLAKYPIHVWPTLLVVNPKKETVVLRYAGGATVPQLSKLLDESEKTYRAKTLSSADSLLSAGDKLSNEEKYGEAAKMYEQSIAKASKHWPHLGRAAEAAVFSLMMARENDRCATLAFDLYPRLRGTVSGANVVSGGLSCATDMKEDAPKRAEYLESLEKGTAEALADNSIPLSGDDRSGLYDSLVSARETAKDEAGAAKLRGEWIAYLEGEAAKAKTAEQRAVYDPHRLTLYIDMKTPEKAIPMLEQSEKDFPNDYNPPSRLALAYKAMRRFDDALAASDRALAKAYGPRKITILRARYDIYTAKGDKEMAKKTLEETIRYAKSLPKEQVSKATIESLEKRLKATS
ncbi:MAG TPA: thiol reductase thioredoxin [Thermoanaerobaculia bacterium]|nr:thiol reductase thioredoxin [Thermoanaerobaculia bacterium]